MSQPAGTPARHPLDRTLSALADPARRRVVDLLREQPRRAGDLAAALSVSPSVMSRHLKVLRDCDLVEERSPEFDTRVRTYSLRSGATAELRSWLDDIEQGWAEQLMALETNVEGHRCPPGSWWRYASRRHQRGCSRPGQETTVRIRFEGLDDSTRVVVEHCGWDLLPQQHAGRHGVPLFAFRQRLAEWWRSQLETLAEHAR